MKKHLKEIIKNSKPYELGKPLSEIYIISTSKLYKGFWEKNGYNGIILIGKYGKYGDFYNINGKYEVDVIRLCDGVAMGGMDIPNDKNCIRVWFIKPVCFTEVLSMMDVLPYREGKHQ